MPKMKTRADLDRVIFDMTRADATLTSNLDARYMATVLDDAVSYLREHREMLDEAEASDKDVAEVGAIIRRQRERIAYLEGELSICEARAIRLRGELDRVNHAMKEIGAL